MYTCLHNIYAQIYGVFHQQAHLRSVSIAKNLENQLPTEFTA